MCGRQALLDQLRAAKFGATEILQSLLHHGAFE
jgi:hypothetical protein